MNKVRCAIYTRKSSEEGLEQDFNSLHAQREACAAYVLSQASEGWSLLPGEYDDGGLSGGTLERPALRRLLTDIEAGKIDIVVVYKVDRLTRSLLDFSKLVEAFDKAGASFVSVTQSFNTTTSMGRLTLNMLLSFAQFEREVTAERIRDKIAASKAKGMWMGGVCPLGYRPDGRSLAIVDEHGLLKMQKAFAAVTMDPVNARASELLRYLGSVGADDASRYNAALSFIESMGPQNQAEVLLLVQMYVTHDAAIRALTQLGSAEWLPTAQTFGNLATKLLRTSQGQMETLGRMRRGGEQVVRHIHVDNRGGQAVIAENVHSGGQGNRKNDEQSHGTGTAGIGPALLGSDAFGNGVPIPSCEGEAALQDARGQEPRSA